MGVGKDHVLNLPQKKSVFQKERRAVVIEFSASHLIKSIGQKRIVKGVSLSVKPGEIVGLLGPNGAGKTTIFLLMAGLMRPDGGKIYLDGRDVTLWPLYRKARLGLRYLPQEPSVFRGLSVEENIMAVLEILEPSPKVRKEQLEQLLEDLCITHLRKRSSLVLSGGERRRVEIARALAGHPRFILLDEPLASIDPKAVEDLQKLIIFLAQRSMGVLITDHNAKELLRIVHRAYIIYDGEVLESGCAADLIASPTVRRVYLGENFSL
ncbi:MAG: LPS export ABC transporter ATP-binding protein [Alphaproteobacteria bacterium 40-19]|nr:MAG: LPS export ABC transporter ATP-binding protein [Alphaproteobacteria bacterium 40-19]